MSITWSKKIITVKNTFHKYLRPHHYFTTTKPGRALQTLEVKHAVLGVARLDLLERLELVAPMRHVLLVQLVQLCFLLFIFDLLQVGAQRLEC